MTPEDWELKFESQGRCCASCRADQPGGHHHWHTDHCHDTRMVRGILCHVCNTGQGLTDNPALLRAKADYLDRWARIHAIRRGDLSAVNDIADDLDLTG